MFLKTSDLNTSELYPLLVGGIIPRPIAWISTLSSDGVDNIAPYSFFTVASCNPPVLAITHVNQGNQQAKDTLLNVQKTKVCVVNVVSAEQIDQMNGSCAAYPSDTSEFRELGIESTISQTVAALGVKHSKVRYECQLRQIITVSDLPAGGVLMLLDVMGIYIDDATYQDGKIDAKSLNAIGKLGGNDYSKTDHSFGVPRPAL